MDNSESSRAIDFDAAAFSLGFSLCRPRLSLYFVANPLQGEESLSDKTVKIRVVIRAGDPLYTVSGGGMKPLKTRSGTTAEEAAGARARLVAKKRMRRMGRVMA